MCQRCRRFANGFQGGGRDQSAIQLPFNQVGLRLFQSFCKSRVGKRRIHHFQPLQRRHLRFEKVGTGLVGKMAITQIHIRQAHTLFQATDILQFGLFDGQLSQLSHLTEMGDGRRGDPGPSQRQTLKWKWNQRFEGIVNDGSIFQMQGSQSSEWCQQSDHLVIEIVTSIEG